MFTTDRRSYVVESDDGKRTSGHIRRLQHHFGSVFPIRYDGSRYSYLEMRYGFDNRMIIVLIRIRISLLCICERQAVDRVRGGGAL